MTSPKKTIRFKIEKNNVNENVNTAQSFLVSSDIRDFFNPVKSDENIANNSEENDIGLSHLITSIDGTDYIIEPDFLQNYNKKDLYKILKNISETAFKVRDEDGGYYMKHGDNDVIENAEITLQSMFNTVSIDHITKPHLVHLIMIFKQLNPDNLVFFVIDDCFNKSNTALNIYKEKYLSKKDAKEFNIFELSSAFETILKQRDRMKKMVSDVKGDTRKIRIKTKYEKKNTIDGKDDDYRFYHYENYLRTISDFDTFSEEKKVCIVNLINKLKDLNEAGRRRKHTYDEIVRTILTKDDDFTYQETKKLMHGKRVRVNEYLDRDLILNIIIKTLEDDAWVIKVASKGDVFVKGELRKSPETFYTLNDNTRFGLYSRVCQGLTLQVADTYKEGSDPDLFRMMMGIDDIEIMHQIDVHKRAKKEGAFFNYFHKIDFDLKRYQIFKKEEDESENYNDNCLIYALKESGLCEKKLSKKEFMNLDRYIPFNRIDQICKIFDICVEITYHESSDIRVRKKKVKKGNLKSDDFYKLGLINDHYFINEEINMKKYAIVNYEKIYAINKKDWSKVTHVGKSGSVKYLKEKKYITSYDLIKYLSDHKERFLEEITNDSYVYKTNFYINKANQYDIKNVDFKDYCEYEVKNTVLDEDDSENSVDIDKEYIRVIADFETVTCEKEVIDKEGNKKNITKLEPGLVVWSFKGAGNRIINKKTYEDINYAVGPYCAIRFLESLPDKSLIIFHNMKFDINFIIKYIKGVQICEKEGNIYKLNGFYFTRKKIKKQIFIKDSYHLLNYKLEDFSKLFPVINNIKKDVMPYAVYTKKNMNKRFIPIDEGIKAIKKQYEYFNKEKYVELFIDNINKWNLKDNNNCYDIVTYSLLYCIQDVSILDKGYSLFRDMIIKEFSIDIDKILTISTLAYSIVKKNKCFEGCYQLSGLVQDFISKAIVGGRTMTRDNEKWKYVYDKNAEGIIYEKIGDRMNLVKSNDVLLDVDFVSLYCSGIMESEGLIKGKPFALKKNINYEELQKLSYYYVEVIIDKVDKHRHMPLLQKLGIDGNRFYTNDMVNNKVIVDKVTLEDLIQYQDVSFTIIQGIGFNEGFNTKLKEIVLDLHLKRIKCIAEGNPMQLIFKLILVSIYGKMGQKDSITKKIYLSNYKKPGENHSRADIYISRNFNSVLSFRHDVGSTKLSEITIRKSFTNYYNECHQCAMILSMSKRLMNRVMYMFEDNNKPILYTDTDSLFVFRKDWFMMSDLYYKKFNKSLDGKNLGQLHGDFSMTKCNEYGEKIKRKDVGEIYSTYALICAKKVYYHQLESRLLDDPNQVVIDETSRLKGMNIIGIDHWKEIQKKTSKDLFDGFFYGANEVLDLCGNMRPRIKIDKFEVTQHYTQTREIAFK